MVEKGGWLQPRRVAAASGLLVVLVLTAWAQRRPLVMFFGPDDYIHLEQASGVLPPPPTVWRIVSQVWYFKWMLALVGPYPPAFHLASLLLHLTNIVLLFALLRSLRVSEATRLGVVGLFGLLPLQYTSLLHAVNINDIGAATLTMASCLLLLRPEQWAVAVSAAAYLAALFWKESVITLFALFPVVAATSNGRARRAMPHMAIALLFGVVFLALRARGLAPGGEVYEARLGFHVLHNYMTYIAWSVALHTPIPDMIGSYDVHAWRAAVPVLLATLTSAAILPRARSIVLIGWGWFVLALVPVALLTHHTYSHYMYVPSIGLAMALAGTLVGWLEAVQLRPKSKAPALVFAATMILVCGYARVSDALLARRVEARLPRFDWPADPFTRKVVVGQRMLGSVAPTITPQTRCIALLALAGDRRVFGARSGKEFSTERRGYDLVEEVLDHGRAFRLFWPQLDSVHFVSTWSMGLADCDAYVRAVEGYAVHCGRGPLALVRAGQLMSNTRDTTGLVVYARSICDAFPNAAEPQLFLGEVLARAGLRNSADASFHKAIALAQSDSVARIASERLRQNATASHH